MHTIVHADAQSGSPSWAEIGLSDSGNSVKIETLASSDRNGGKGHRATFTLSYASREEMLLHGAIEAALMAQKLHEKFPDLEGAVPELTVTDHQQLEAILEARREPERLSDEVVDLAARVAGRQR